MALQGPERRPLPTYGAQGGTAHPAPGHERGCHLRAPVFIVHVGSVAHCSGGGGGAGRAGCRCPRPPPQKIPGHSGDDGQDKDEPKPACAPIGCRGCRRGGGSGLRESLVQRNERRSRRDLERLEHDGRPFAILAADSGQVMRSAEDARLEGQASSNHLAGAVG